MFRGRWCRRGQSTTEYILIVVLVAVLSIGIITVFGNQIRDLLIDSSPVKLYTEVVDDHLGSFTGKQDGLSPADSTARSSNNSNFSFQCAHVMIS